MAPATVNRLSEAFAQILKSPGIQEAFRVGGVEAKWAGPDEFSVIIRNSYRQWGQSLSELGYKKE
jgi:tripartite-type tricarboxylate transporter receptor subunit TctC